MKKTYKVVMLSTEKESNLWLRNNKLEYNCSPSFKINPQHLYITSNEKIKEGDWCIYDKTNIVFKAYNIKSKTVVQASDLEEYHISFCKKIIATTDKSLRYVEEVTGITKLPLTFNIPQIPESFIKAYIESYNSSNPITEVNLEMTLNGSFEKAVSADEMELSYQVKTRDDNTVIIHKSKVYSLEEVKDLLHQAARFGRLTHKEDIGRMPDLTNQWIEETL